MLKRWRDKTLYNKAFILILCSLMLTAEGTLTWDCMQIGKKVFYVIFPLAQSICLFPVHSLLNIWQRC